MAEYILLAAVLGVVSVSIGSIVGIMLCNYLDRKWNKERHKAFRKAND